MNDPRKPFFDAARAADEDHVLTDEDVAKIDAVLDLAGIPRGPVEPAPEELQVGPEGIALIKQFEGCARLRADGMVEAYPDPGTGGKPYTIGFGTTRIDGKPFGLDLVITRERAEQLLAADLERYAAEVRDAIGNAPTSQAQFDALVSFHYNTGAIARATLTKMHVAGDFADAAEQFARWNRAGGRVLKGLVRRRAAEAKLYRSGS